MADQRASFLARAAGVPRAVALAGPLRQAQVTAVCGIRRCGKSTLLRQIAEQLGGRFHYLNLDDERLLEFTIQDFERLMLAFHGHSDARTLIFDEIQNVPGWERFVRRVHDEGYKVVLTGSNARLLSAELGTHLTGRHNQVELFPFSFSEFLDFHGVNKLVRTTAGKAAILRRFDEYLEHGGFPEQARGWDLEGLQRLYEDILFRDIAARHRLRDTRGLQQLAHYLFTNIGTEVSYRKLQQFLDFASATSVRSFIGFLEQAYLLFEVKRFDYSLRKQHVNNKKGYGIDTGMRNAVSFRFSQDSGRLLENTVAVELRRRGGKLFFFRGQGECDFVVAGLRGAVEAIQVCWELHREIEGREAGGLAEAMRALRLPKGTILTYNQDDELVITEGRIRVLPVWRWMLDAASL